ncbi:MAG TPA: aminotransferase class V-fold PLP-dependent enzyme [Polyangiales bacterium]
MQQGLRLGERALFPALEAQAYLAHAAVSPPSRVVQEAVSACLADYGARGIHAAIAAVGLRQRLRGQLAELLGAQPEQLGLIQSTTAGVIAIARSIVFQPGERVIVFAGEFPANVTPWQCVARERDLELVMLPLAPFLRSADEGLDLVARELARGARLVAVSAVQFQTGLRMPLAELSALCHRHGAELFVDAIQAVGAVPLDVHALDVDYLAAGAHKFLMGIEGAGVLYVHPRCMQQLSLGLAGWTGHEDAFAFLRGEPDLLRYDRPLVRSASFVEQGALSIASCAALSASLTLLLDLGIDVVFRHVNQYLDALEPCLSELGFESLRCADEPRRSAMLCARPPAALSAGTIAQALQAAGIVISTPDGHVRFAPHWPNGLHEVELVASELRKLMRG